jgi:hypothetical protein
MTGSGVWIDPDLLAAFRALAVEMAEDGDCYVEHYGRQLTDLLRLLAGDPADSADDGNADDIGK